jgi:putative transposase
MDKRKKKKKLIKARKKEVNKNIIFMNECVKKHSNDFPLDILNNTQRPYYKDTNSFYDFKNTSFINEDKIKHKFIKLEFYDKIPLKCNQIILLPNNNQKKILLDFMETSRIMYNETIKLIKTRYFNKEKTILSYRKLRTLYLKDIKEKLMKQYNAYCHVLDQDINSACAMYKSALSNLKNKNIKHFRIRYKKRNSNSLIIHVEQTYFRDNKIFVSKIKEPMLNKDNYNYDLINHDSIIHYNKSTKIFTLFLPTIPIEKTIINNDYISIDAGMRTFLTCMTNKSIIEIGSNIGNEIKKILLKIDKTNNMKKDLLNEELNKRKKFNRIKHRNLTHLRERLKNKVKDMHCKIINYLTNTYKTIVIGKWSTKAVVKNETSVLSKMNKRICLSMSFYKFLQRLEFKSKINKNDLYITNECYTSMTCSTCGYLKRDLGGSKVFNCDECKNIMDRDVNSCRNMIYKCLD